MGVIGIVVLVLLYAVSVAVVHRDIRVHFKNGDLLETKPAISYFQAAFVRRPILDWAELLLLQSPAARAQRTTRIIEFGRPFLISIALTLLSGTSIKLLKKLFIVQIFPFSS